MRRSRFVGSSKPPSFAGQRMIFIALLLGMTMFAIVAAVVIQQNDGKGLAETPIEMLDTVVLLFGGVAAILAIGLRILLTRRLAKLTGEQRGQAQFISRLIPLVVLEGACLFALTTWLLNGNAVPDLVVAMVLLSFAIAIVPLKDPDVGARASSR